MIDAGGGHRAAARALLAAAEESHAPFALRVENYQQILLGLDPLHKLTGISVEDAYNLILRRRWNAALVPLMRLMHGVIRLRRRAIVRLVTGWLAERPRPAAVVSVMPNFNGIMADALHAAHPGVPLVVVLTDFADFPPRFWIEPGIDRVVVGSDEAREQAIALGIPPDRVSRVSGMILRPGFYRSSGPEARERMRAELEPGARRLRRDAAFRRQGLARDAPARRRPARGRPERAGRCGVRRQPGARRAA